MATTNERLAEAVSWMRAALRSDYGGVQEALAEDLGYEGSVVSKILSGTYEGSPENVIRAVNQLRTSRVFKQHAKIDTLVTERIEEGLQYAEGTRSLVAVHGPTGSSKTLTLTTWCRESARRLYAEVPTECSRVGLVRLLARALGIDTDGKRQGALADEVFGKLSKRHVVVIDDAGYLQRTSSRSSGPGPIGLIKDLVDQIGCGVVIAMESQHWQELICGPRRHVYAHLVGRIGWTVGIPNRGGFRDEVGAIVRALIPDAGDDILALGYEIAQERERLRPLFGDLRKALHHATEHGRQVTADDVRKARLLRRKASDPALWPKQ